MAADDTLVMRRETQGGGNGRQGRRRGKKGEGDSMKGDTPTGAVKQRVFIYEETAGDDTLEKRCKVEAEDFTFLGVFSCSFFNTTNFSGILDISFNSTTFM